MIRIVFEIQSSSPPFPQSQNSCHITRLQQPISISDVEGRGVLRPFAGCAPSRRIHLKFSGRNVSCSFERHELDNQDDSSTLLSH